MAIKLKVLVDLTPSLYSKSLRYDWVLPVISVYGIVNVKFPKYVAPEYVGIVIYSILVNIHKDSLMKYKE